MIPRPSHVSLKLNVPAVEIGRVTEIDEPNRQRLDQHINDLMPWRKGPFKLFGNLIDSEWKSDMKWNRLAPHLGNLKNKKILDVGCNNGYFLFRLAGAGAKEVLGIDPVEHFQKQFQFMQHFAQIPSIQMKSWGIQDMHHFDNEFDLVFHMGVIYHHKDPIGQLNLIHKALKPKGKVILESIGIPGELPWSLTPNRRYANMRNIYFVPTLMALMNWMKKSKFRHITPLYSIPSTSCEQRVTDRCPPGYKSFIDTLDPDAPHLTREGYPAPLRLAVSAEK